MILRRRSPRTSKSYFDMTTQTLQKWKNTQLGDVFTLNYGKGLPARDRVNGEFPVYGSAGIVGYHNRPIAKAPGIIVGRKGSIGEIYFSKKDYYPIDTSYYINSSDKYDIRFSYHLLKQLNLKTLNTDAAVPGLNRNVAYQQKVRIPDLFAQRSIAGILLIYDDLIENNTRRIKILEQMAQAIYTEQFDSASQKKEKKVPLGEIIKIHRGKSYSSDELSENEGIPFVNLKCLVRDGGFRKSGLKWFIGKYKNTQKVVAGDTVMAVTDMTQDRRIVARAARVPTLEGGFGVISMDLVKIEPKDGNDKDYIYSLLRWSGFPDEVKNHANGANVLHLIPDRITDYKTYVAPTDQQKEFGEKARPLLNLIDKLELQDESLRQTRDLLLPKLVTGEIRV